MGAPTLFPPTPPPTVVCLSHRLHCLLLTVACGLVLTLGAGPAAAQSLPSAPPDVQQQVRHSLHGSDLQGKDGPLSKIGARLATLYHQHQARGAAGVKRLARTEARQTERTRYGPVVSQNGRFVTVDAIAATTPSRLHAALRRLGLKHGARAGTVVSGRLPISALRAAADLPSLRGLLPAAHRMHVGSVGSEADTAHAAYKGRQDLGVDGSGLKICVLSDSYNQDGSAMTTASDDVTSGDLPSDVDVLDDSFTNGTDEGRAMLQLIHDIAPGAELGFHTAVGGLGAFVNGIRDLADPNQGDCDIIVDDIGYNTEPFYQDGPVSNVADSVANEGIPYFSSAGNDGQNAYTAPFRNSGNPGVISPSTAVAHDFDPSSASTDTLQEITIQPGGDFGFFTFQWTDPSSVITGSNGADTDLDVALVNDTLGVVDSSLVDNITAGLPFESLRYENNGNVDTDNDGTADSTFHLVIEKYSGPDPDSVKYIYSGSGYTIEDGYGDTGTATIYGHPMAEKAMAVAAAPFYNTNAYSCFSGSCPTLEDFSSKGGIPVLFDQDGNRLASPEQRQKPDVTAADGINNTFFGSDSGADSNNHPNFFGTSAAAPNVAAIAALILEANPGYSPSDLYNHLKSNATDVTRRINENNALESTGTGVDPWSGHGFVQAVASALPVELAQFSGRADVETAVLTWRTASETNNAGFAVEHKSEDGSFTEMAFKEGAGTTEDPTRYRYRTPTLEVGTHTFRLRQVDLDGSATYTDPVTVDVSLSGAYSVSPVSPNPLRGPGTVSVTVRQSQPVTAAVYNVLGQQVATLHDGPLPAQTPTTLRLGSALSSGVYFLRVEGESFATTRKFVRLE